MRRWVCFVAVPVLAVAMMSCGDDDETGETTATTAAAVTVPSGAELEAMLLTEVDIEAALGSDPSWSVQPLEGAQSLSGYLQVPCDDAALNPTIIERLTADVAIDASRADGNATLLEFLIAGDADQLSSDLDVWTTADESCVAAESTSADTTATRELTLPELGDEQFAEAGTCEGWGPDSQYLALVRVGTVAVLVGVCQGAESRISDEEFVQLVESAVAKVDG